MNSLDIPSVPTKSVVERDLQEARSLAQDLGLRDLKNGEYFLRVLESAFRAYDRNGRAEFFRRKYAGLPPDDIADVLSSVASRYAAILGGVAGTVTSASSAALGASGGATAASWIIAAGTELICLGGIQMRLAIDIATLYGVELDAEDPEDLLLVFGYALGIAPAEALGKGLATVGRSAATTMVKRGLSKGTLKSAQQLARRVGIKLLQRSVIKFVVPVASMAVGSTYNYVSTRAVARIAGAQFRSRGLAVAEMKSLMQQSRNDELALPAAVLHMASLEDGVSRKERELYRSVISLLGSLPGDADGRLRTLIQSEESIMDALESLEDRETKVRIIEILGLMAAYDGDFAAKEKQFLIDVAARLGVPVDLDRIESKALAFRVKVEEPWIERSAQSAREMVIQTAGHASDAGRWLAESSSSFAGRLRGLLRRSNTPAGDLPKNDPILALISARTSFDVGEMDEVAYEAKKRDLLMQI